MKPAKTATRFALALACMAVLSACSSIADPQTGLPTSVLAKPATDAARAPNKAVGAPGRPDYGAKVFGPAPLKSTELQFGETQQPPLEVDDSGNLYNLDLNNTDVRDLSALILGTILERNYVIEDRVQGLVSIHTSSGVRKEDLIPLLRAAVTSRGGELLDDGDLVRIVAGETGSQVSFRNGNRLDIMPVALKNASAIQMRRVLLPLARDLVDVAADGQSNMVILSGALRHMLQLRELAETLDVDAAAGKSMRLFALQNANVEQVMDELAQITDVDGTARLVPIRRLNAIFAMSGNSDRLSRLESWIRLLDQNGGKNDRSIYVYHALSGSVSELAATAAAVLGYTAGSAVQQQAPLQSIDAPTEAVEGETGLDSLFSADAPVEDLPIPSDVDPAPQPDLSGAPRIVPDARGSQIIVHATASEWQRISAVLHQLDRMPQQVMIEATIVEVSLNDSLRYGLQFLFGSGDASFSLPAFESTGLSASPGSRFNFTFDNGQSTQVILDALSSVTDVNVISSPRLMVLSNETATLQIGDQVPVALQSAVPIEANDNRIINSIEFRDTGVILRVTPNVGSSDTILIDVDQEISDVAATTSSNIDSPTIRQRRVSSKLSVQDGETIAFAGLTRNSTSDVKNGIPIARELPLLGPLFGSTEKVSSRSELLILLTPRIVRNLDDARAVTNELKSKIGQLMVSVPENPSLD